MTYHEPLSGKREVYALDLPGHGESSKQLERGDVREFAEIVAAFMAAVQIPKAHLIGHSLGGAIAATTAISHPERVASLTLIASAGLGDGINAEYIEGFVEAKTRNELKPHLRQLFAADPKRAERMTVQAAGLFLDYSKNRITDETLRLLLQLAAESGLRERIDAMFRGDRINVSENRSVLHVALRMPPPEKANPTVGASAGASSLRSLRSRWISAFSAFRTSAMRPRFVDALS
jgi:pimeloyl-ACP methyl ester carboxylesterase